MGSNTKIQEAIETAHDIMELLENEDFQDQPRHWQQIVQSLSDIRDEVVYLIDAGEYYEKEDEAMARLEIQRSLFNEDYE